jgi:membrane dipeptidase
VDRLNQAKVIVDCSHTGARTSLDAIERSSAPVILSHSNVASVHASPRNVSNELMDAIAKSGGVIGVVGFPGMVSGSARRSLAQFVAHLDAIVDRVGIDHVGLGLDYYASQHGVASDEAAIKGYHAAISAGVWTTAYPPPPHFIPPASKRRGRCPT